MFASLGALGVADVFLHTMSQGRVMPERPLEMMIPQSTGVNTRPMDCVQLFPPFDRSRLELGMLESLLLGLLPS